MGGGAWGEGWELTLILSMMRVDVWEGGLDLSVWEEGEALMFLFSVRPIRSICSGSFKLGEWRGVAVGGVGRVGVMLVEWGFWGRGTGRWAI